jgi:hypothetical protein
VEKLELELEKLVSVSADGFTSVNGSFVSVLKKHLNKASLLYHCIVHQENLISRCHGDCRYKIRMMGQLVCYI